MLQQAWYLASQQKKESFFHKHGTGFLVEGGRGRDGDQVKIVLNQRTI